MTNDETRMTNLKTMTDPKNWPIVSESTPEVTDLHFNIRKAPRGQATDQLILSLSAKLVDSLGFEKGGRYALRFNADIQCFALMPDAQGARLRVPHKSPRFHLYFICKGMMGDLWAFEPCSNEPLTIRRQERGCLVFEYPTYEEAETEADEPTAEEETEPEPEPEEEAEEEGTAPANPWARSRL